MRRRPPRVRLALACVALGVLAAHAVDAQVPPPPPAGTHGVPPPPPAGNPPHSDPGQMATIPRSTAFFIAGVEIAVIVAAIVVGVGLPARAPAPTPLPSGPPETAAEPKRPAP